jgi:hypothetical protein
MSVPITLRRDFSASELRGLAKKRGLRRHVNRSPPHDPLIDRCAPLRRHAAGLVLAEQLGRRAPPRFILEIEIPERGARRAWSYRGGYLVGFHSRASCCASAICAAVICCAT